MQTVARQRPVGITVISVVLAVSGVLTIITGILGLFSLSNASSAVQTSVLTGSIIALIGGILNLLLAWGLWTLKRWAFWATVIIEVLNVLVGLYDWIGLHVDLLSVLLSIGLPIFILIYLFVDHNVRAAFRT